MKFLSEAKQEQLKLLVKYHFESNYCPTLGYELDQDFNYYGKCERSHLVRTSALRKVTLTQRGLTANNKNFAEIEVGSSLASAEVHNSEFFNTIFVVTPLAIFTEAIVNELKISGYAKFENLTKCWTKILVVDHYGKLSESISDLSVTIKYL